MEIWKTINGYDLYEVSSMGRVRRKAGYQSKNERYLKPLNNGHGYMSVTLSLNSVVKRLYIHRLVAIAFLDNPEQKEEVNHIDGKRDNNFLENLEWTTRSENHYHRYQVLKQRGVNYGKTGKNNWNSKAVKRFDLNGVLICEYAGVLEAQRQTGISESNIRGCIYGKQKTAGGSKWQYK
jgi:hypothetical protein